jgi:hypothetical protein
MNYVHHARRIENIRHLRVQARRSSASNQKLLVTYVTRVAARRMFHKKFRIRNTHAVFGNMCHVGVVPAKLHELTI